MRETYYTTSWQGLLLDTEEEYEELISELNNASPKTTHIYNNLAVAYMEMGKGEMVLPSLEEAIKLDPENAIVYVTAASYHGYYTKDFFQMIWNYTKAIEINPGNPSFYIGRAGIYMRQEGKEELAYNDYKQSYSLNSQNEYVLKQIRQLEALLFIKPEDSVQEKRSWKDGFMSWIKGK